MGWAQSFTYGGNDYATLEAVFANISGTGTYTITVNDNAGTIGSVCTIASGQTVTLVSSASGTQRTITRNATDAQISIASGGTLQMTDIIMDGGSTAATPITASVSLIENASTNTLTLNNCKFQNCKRYKYIASTYTLKNYANGGCVYSSVTLTISGDAVFDNCTTELENDDLHVYWQFTLTENNANGGGIYSLGNVTITGDAMFTNCESKVRIYGTHDTGDRDVRRWNGCGGGIYAVGAVSISGDANFATCKTNYVSIRTVTNNTDDNIDGSGGGIFSQTNVNISGHANFTNCLTEASNTIVTKLGTAPDALCRGGGICSVGGVTVSKNATFNGCRAIVNCFFDGLKEAKEAGYGGGIYAGTLITIFGDASFMDCSAVYNADFGAGIPTIGNAHSAKCAYGGGIHGNVIFKGQATITNCFATGITGIRDAGRGGGIYGNVTFDGDYDYTISNNSASIFGGGICGIVTVNSGTVSFSNNSVNYGGTEIQTWMSSGGGINGSLIVNGGSVSFTSNTAPKGSGGGIYTNEFGVNKFGNITVNDGFMSFTNNTAGYYGGAIRCGSSSPNVQSTNYIKNTVIGGSMGLGNTAQEGGGIYHSGYSELTLDNVSVSYNSADYGGGVCIGSPINMITTLLNSNINNNTASLQGGGMYVNHNYSNTQTIVSSGTSTISNNSAGRQGGGIYFSRNGWGAIFTGPCYISNNTAGGYQDGDGGGGVYVQGKRNTTGTADNQITVLLDGITLSGNIAYGRGGGLYVAEESTGSELWQGPSVLLRNCTITGNQALADPFNSTHDLGNGGGIYAHGSKLAASNPYTDGYLKVVGGTIAGNQSLRNGCPLDHYCLGNGGGVYAYAGTVMLSGVNIGTSGNANSADRNGGGVFVNEHADLTLNGAASVAYNTAVNGAGIYTLGNLTMDGSTFTVSNNTATGYGGGINLSHADINDPEEIGFLGTMSYSVDPSDPSFVDPGTFNYKVYNASDVLVGDFPFDGSDYEDLLAPGTYTVRLSKTDGISDFSSLASLTLAISDIDGSITPNGDAPVPNETDITFTTFTDGYEICTFTVRSPADLGGLLTMSNSITLSGNSAAYGGGLFIGSHTTANMTGGTIGGSTADKNTASTKGGGVYKLGTLKVGGGGVTVTDNQSGTAKAYVTDNVYIPTTAAEPYVLVSGTFDCGSSIGITKTKTDHTYLDDDNYTTVRTVVATNATPGSGYAVRAFGRSVFFDDTDTYGVWCFNYPQNSHDDYSSNNCYFIETWRNFTNASGFTGSGPYSVSSAAGLAYLAQQVNSGTDYAGAVINQTTDLDLSSHYWEPIGTSDIGDCGIGDKAFAGTFNGNGHFVTGAKAVLPFKDNGLFGNVSGTLRHIFVMNGEYQGSHSASGHVGGIVGKTTGLIDGCEVANITLTSTDDTQSAGLIAGTVASGGEVRNSFAVGNTIALGASGSIASAGGLAGSIASGGAVRNCYAKNNTLDGTAVGALVGNNEGTLSNCYSNATTGTLVGTGTAGSNVYAAGATDATYTYTATIGADNLGYQYADNTVNSVAMFKQLSANATALGAGYAQWARPGLTEINGDLPVLMFDAYNGSVGSFSSVGTYNGSADVLQYGGTARDGDQLNSALTRTGTGTNCLFVYGDVTAAPTTAAASYTQSKVSIYEHASITAPGTLKDYESTYVGVTFDNAAADAGIGAMSTDQMNGLGSQSLYRDWHMLSSPLSSAPIGFDYGSDNNGSGPQHNPWTGNDSWTRYWMQDYASADGYFPTSRGSLFTEGQVFIPGSDEYNHRDVYQYGMDLYCWSEPDYHWINFKRNGNDHWSSEEPHNHIDYFGSATNVNEGYLLEGKGYLASICKETFLQSHGSLNSGTDFKTRLNLTKNGAKCTGWNLVGNPFHSYLSFDALASANTAVLGADPLYVVYEAEGFGTSGNGTLGNGYLYYPYTGSPGGAYARPYLHPHQGFFVFAENEGKLNFNESTMAMSRSVVGANGNYRESRTAYPLVNLFLTSENGCSDVCVVEFNRPEWGGAYKQKALRMGNGQLYAYHDGNEYAALFATAEAQRIPVYFEAKESDTYTLHWNTANGDFSQLILVDNMTGVQYDMLRNDSYSFSGTEDDYKSRFYICFAVLGMDEFEDDTSPGGTTFAFFDGSQWVVTNTGNGPAQLDLIDLQGRVLHRATLGEGGQTRVSLPEVAKGMYLLRRSSANGTQVQKIIIK